LVDTAELVETAGRHFNEGADSAFLACFDEDVHVYGEPEVSSRAVVTSRSALGDWIARLRKDHRGLGVTITPTTLHGAGAVCEIVVIRDTTPAEVWRVALAICCDGGLISQVRGFWGREAAIAWLVGSE
jgi:hypothetical protein